MDIAIGLDVGNNMAIENPREIRGVQIAAKGNEIKRLNSSTYKVRSQSTPDKWYLVVKNDLNEWTCECPDHIQRQVTCKHIYSTRYSLDLRQKVTERNLNLGSENAVNDQICPKCSSTEIVKDGVRKTKNRNVQRYTCKLCHFRFIPSNAFMKVKSTPQAITASLDLYFKGCSLHDIKDHLKQFYNLKVSHVAILKWIRKYTGLMTEYADQLTPDAGGIWHTDEMMVSVRKTTPIDKERYSWLWNLMDNDTRFLLASQIHKRREVNDARSVFAEAKERTKTSPVAVVHDGLHSYNDAFNKEFYTLAGPRVTNIRSVGAANGYSSANQMIERLNGTIREREKVMRGMDTDESAQKLLDGNRLFYNFIRPHMGLNGLTPAEKAGLDLGLTGNRWENLIRRAYISRQLQAKDGEGASP